jgi:hypothetical protein
VVSKLLVASVYKETALASGSTLALLVSLGLKGKSESIWTVERRERERERLNAFLLGSGSVCMRGRD